MLSVLVKIYLKAAKEEKACHGEARPDTGYISRLTPLDLNTINDVIGMYLKAAGRMHQCSVARNTADQS